MIDFNTKKYVCFTGFMLFILLPVCHTAYGDTELPETSQPPVFLAIYEKHSDTQPAVSVPSFINPHQTLVVQEQSSLAGKYKLGSVLIPLLSLGSLVHVFATASDEGIINASSGSFLEYYDSLLVLGGVNFLADGIAGSCKVLFDEYGIDSVYARGAAAIFMFVPMEWKALARQDSALNMNKLSFSQAANHYGFKSSSNQANHVVTQLASSYMVEGMFQNNHPVVRKMVAKSISAGVIATPWILTVLVDAVYPRTDKSKNIYFDSGVDFLFSTSITTMKSVVQMGMHHFLDGHKDPDVNAGVSNAV